MLFVTAQIDGDLYAIDSRFVIEIIPIIDIKSHQLNSNDNLGYINYRGAQIPIFDLTQLVAGRISKEVFSSRIMILDIEEKVFGLLSEQVTETLKITDDSCFIESKELIDTKFFSKIIKFKDKQYYLLNQLALMDEAFPQ
jgi:chemotaxis-related protein WspB